MIFWIGALFASLVGYFIYDAFRKQQYWKTKGVPSLFPYPVIGQFAELIMIGQGKFDQKWTQLLGRKFGYFDGPVPVIEISDTDMLRNIMVKDFSHFVDRRTLEGVNGEVLDQAVSVLKGQHWKDVRSVLVPTFTSGKMRQMNPFILDCCKNMVKNMEEIEGKNQEFEAKELYGRVTLDVIASAFFGTKIDSQSDPNSEFVTQAKKAFDFSLANPLFLIAFIFPKLMPLALKLGIEAIPKTVIDFFVNNTKEILRLRTENPQNNRKDFLQIMVKSLRSGADNAVPNKSSSHTSASTTESHVRSGPAKEVEEENDVDIVSQNITHSGDSQHAPHSDYKLTTEELVAQAVIFFLAGYETTATSLSFFTYNMATHPEIQDKLRNEIERVMAGSETPTYDLIAQMDYLDMCVNETLRLFPPVARTERECTEDWQFDGLHIEKGTIVAIPIYAIQRDPEYWPEPEKFDPERFSYENKQDIKPYTFQTFGQGPRNCIGMRFAIYEIKMVMVCVLRKFRIVASARTQIPLQLKDVGFISAKNGVWTKLEKV